METKYDISIIRPEVRLADVLLKARDLPKDKFNKIKKGLLTLHTLEVMATNIYKYQITKEENELNRYLIASMLNEMTHIQDFQIRLYEYGLKPSKLRWAYWLVGFAFGFTSRILGKRAILKTGIWVESKAVEHYSKLLETIDWDAETRRVIEKDQADEYGHIERWKTLLSTVSSSRGG